MEPSLRPEIRSTCACQKIRCIHEQPRRVQGTRQKLSLCWVGGLTPSFRAPKIKYGDRDTSGGASVANCQVLEHAACRFCRRASASASGSSCAWDDRVVAVAVAVGMAEYETASSEQLQEQANGTPHLSLTFSQKAHRLILLLGVAFCGRPISPTNSTCPPTS